MILKKEIIEQLSTELLLPFSGTEQDWDLEMADSKRINDFLNFYRQNDLSVDKKIALMSLILASYDDFLNENNLRIDGRWVEIRDFLKSEKIIFADLMDYWALNDEKTNNEIFLITPLVRNLKNND